MAEVILLLVVLPLLAGIGRRGFGGGWSTLLGRTVPRAASAALLGLLVALPVSPYLAYWQTVLVGLLAAVGPMLYGFGAHGMDMGRRPPLAQLRWADWAQDAVSVGEHGVASTAGLALASLSPLVLLAGLSFPLLYEAAYRFPLHFPRFGFLNDPSKGLVDPCPTGEFLSWAAVGLALGATILVNS